MNLNPNLIKQQVDSGMYQDSSEVVRDALRKFFAVPTQDEIYEVMFEKSIQDFNDGKMEVMDNAEDFLNSVGRDERAILTELHDEKIMKAN